MTTPQEASRAAFEAPTDLHAAIMNLPCAVPHGYPFGSELCVGVYRQGHRDARHAAAAIVAAATAARDAEVAALRDALKPPEGFQLLPVEATDSMMDADWDVTMSEAHSSGGVAAAAWRAMVEAAPQVTYGNGHSGEGWYMHDTEYSEEGAVFLSDPQQ